MKLTILLSIVFSLFLIGACAEAKLIPSKDRPLRVLFIGNSYTGVNNLPALVAGLAEAAGEKKVEAVAHVKGGVTLQQQFEETGAVDKIRAKKWDFVVLQEQSVRPISEPGKMHEFARKLHEEIEQKGAKTVLYLTWARQDKPANQDRLDKAYFEIAKELGATVAPVGPAWHRALAADPKLILHAKDKSHPNDAGSYLAACVFYATLFEKSPEGLPAEIKQNGKTLLKLDPERAKQLQAVAWKTVEEVRSGKLPRSKDVRDLPPPTRLFK